MKKLIVLTSLFCFIGIGCIPSLHPIYTKNDTIVDDRIVGSWVHNMESNSLVQTFQDSVVDNFAKNIIDMLAYGQDAIDQEWLNQAMGSFKPQTSWRFERAVNIKGKYAAGRFKGQEAVISNTTELKSLDAILYLDEIEVEKLDHYILTFNELFDSDETEKVMNVYLTKIGDNTFLDFSPNHRSKKSSLRFPSSFVPSHTFAKVVIEDDGIQIAAINSEFVEELIRNKRVRLKHELVNDEIILTASTKELRAFLAKYGSNPKLFNDVEELVNS